MNCRNVACMLRLYTTLLFCTIKKNESMLFSKHSISFQTRMFSALPLKLMHSFILITWLFSVSRSIRAAVKCSFLKNIFHCSNPRFVVINVLLFLCRLCIKVKNRPNCTGSASTYPTSSYVKLNIM